MKTRRGFSFTEVLMALGILALVLCGALIFLQTNLMFYRKQMQGVRGALVAQSLLDSDLRVGKGRIENLDYLARSDQGGHWLHLEVGSGSLIVCQQSLWRLGSDRHILYQDYETLQWTLADCESGAEEALSQQEAIPLTDGRRLTWQGVSRYEGLPQDPQLSPDQRKIGFLQEGQAWVLDLASKQSVCWGRGSWLTLSWHDSDSLIVGDGSKFVKLDTHGRSETLYEGPVLAQASFSPDLKQIAFVDRPGDENNDLFIYDREHRERHAISATPEGEVRPLWSPDGLRILYGEAPAAGGTRLKCINPDGSGLQDLEIVASVSNWKWR